MQITDRAKDVIKSGGEWISTIDIENLAVGHPDVAEAAVIGVAHPKWDERPLLVVVAKEGHSPKSDEVLDFLKPRIAKWWMPDDMQVVKEIPHTATGKINKLKLRETFKGTSCRRLRVQSCGASWQTLEKGDEGAAQAERRLNDGRAEFRQSGLCDLRRRGDPDDPDGVGHVVADGRAG